MKILFVTKELYPENSTGLGISSKLHLDILRKKFIVKTVSKNKKELANYSLNFQNLFELFLNFFSLKKKANKIMNDFNPDIIILEGLQTVISEFFLILDKRKTTRIFLISHGLSIFPYRINLRYLFRFIVYLFYLPFLYILIKKVNVQFSLNWTNKSNRHIDDKIYKLSNKKSKIVKYFNTSRFEKYNLTKISSSIKIVSCFGYIGEIKNQKDFLNLAEKLKKLNVHFRIIYQDFDEKYLKQCKKICENKKLKNIFFIDGNKTDLKIMMQETSLIVNVSLTEVFPLTLVEGISMGVPFVSYDTGNISFLKGGLLSKNIKDLTQNTELLLKNEFFYKKISEEGKEFYLSTLSNNLLVEQFESAINNDF